MPLTQLKWTLAAILVFFVVSPLAAQQSPALDALPKKAQDEIGRICLPVQFREGAAAYRNCVQTEIASQANASSSAISELSFDDKYAVQQACAKAGGQSSSAYKSCVSDQLAQLNTLPEPVLSDLSEDELYAVQQTCFDAQSKQGAARYRQCLNSEIASLLAVPAADTSALSMIHKNALQLRCSANSSTAAQYRECIGVEFESIAGTAPSFLPVATAARVAVSESPSIETTSRSNTSRQNTANAISEVARSSSQQAKEVATPSVTAQTKAVETKSEADNLPVANESTRVMALPRNIKPPQENTRLSTTDSASPQTTSANKVVRTSTLRDATSTLNAAVNEADKTIPTALANQDARIISRPDLVQALELQEQAKEQGIELEPAAQTNSNAETASSTEPGWQGQLQEWWQAAFDRLGTLDRMGWLILAGLLALPAVLLGLFSLLRRLAATAPFEPITNPALTGRIEPGLQTRRRRHEEQAAELFAREEAPQANSEPHDASAPDPAADFANEKSADFVQHNQVPDIEHDAATRLAMKPEATQKMEQPAEKTIPWRSAFGPWLMQQPESDRRELSVEFLIYWAAFADERYEPELKKRLFTATDLDAHDQIKRWVLKQDVFAFADVIQWLRRHASPVQQQQILTLLMALLVTENSVTPVQNTLIRFLSDAFNIGSDALEGRFERLFGHSLPPMPRPDRAAWWHKQQQAEIQHWNLRAVSALPEKEQMLRRLGLTTEYDDADVIQSFKRAARRCHPDRFKELGDRERTMAEQCFARYEEARDKLLGVSV